jgi:hypothetical protein
LAVDCLPAQPLGGPLTKKLPLKPAESAVMADPKLPPIFQTLKDVTLQKIILLARSQWINGQCVLRCNFHGHGRR